MDHKALNEAMDTPRPLTDAGMKKMIPLFVKGRTHREDHKCGSCSMRVMPNGCTVVDGDIDMTCGVCSLWAKGEASTPADVHRQLLPKTAAGYEEVDGAVNCSTCAAYGNHYCRVWEGEVAHGDCCLVWNKK